MLALIIGIVLAGYAYRRGLRPRAEETVSPLFEGKYGRVFAGFMLLLGFGIAALSQKPEWTWGSDLAIAVGVWFWTMTEFKQTGEPVQKISAAVSGMARRDRLAWGVTWAIWVAGGFIIPAVVTHVFFGDKPGYAAGATLLWWIGAFYIFALVLLHALVSRILSPKRERHE